MTFVCWSSFTLQILASVLMSTRLRDRVARVVASDKSPLGVLPSMRSCKSPGSAASARRNYGAVTRTPVRVSSMRGAGRASV
jgi:hypothetical protein